MGAWLLRANWRFGKVRTWEKLVLSFSWHQAFGSGLLPCATCILVCKTQNAMGLISFCSSSSGHPLHGLGHKAKPDISRLRNRHDIETINIDTLNHISSKEWQIRSQNFGITKQASPFQKIDLCLRGKLNSPARPSQVRKHWDLLETTSWKQIFGHKQEPR